MDKGTKKEKKVEKEKMKPQLVMIGGGMTFKSRADYVRHLESREVSVEKKWRWRNEYLDKKLGKDFEIIRVSMPCPDNARYDDWKIAFEKYIPFLRKGLVFAGESLGGIFLARYLSENIIPKKISAVIFVAAPYDGSLSDEDLSGGFRLGKNLSLIHKNCSDLNFFFSEDDDTVPVSHATKYAKKLPEANYYILKSAGGHFRIPEFPEFVRLVKKKAGLC